MYERKKREGVRERDRERERERERKREREGCIFEIEDKREKHLIYSTWDSKMKEKREKEEKKENERRD